FDDVGCVGQADVVPGEAGDDGVEVFPIVPVAHVGEGSDGVAVAVLVRDDGTVLGSGVVRHAQERAAAVTDGKDVPALVPECVEGTPDLRGNNSVGLGG